jgi:hypothetical protein
MKEDKMSEEEPEPPMDRCDEIISRLANMSSVAHPGYTLEVDRVDDEEKIKKPRKSKYQAAEYMIIVDDLSGELKSNSLVELLKKNRHYKNKIIISSQYMNDLKPESRKQIDIFMIFKGFNDKKLAEIHKDCDSSVPFETFQRVYKQATEKPFTFLYIDTRSDKFRCCFNHEFIIID